MSWLVGAEDHIHMTEFTEVPVSPRSMALMDLDSVMTPRYGGTYTYDFTKE